MKDSSHQYLKYYTTLLLFIVLAYMVLYYGRALLIPFTFAIVISMILYPICLKIEKRAGRSVAISIGLVLLGLFGLLLLELLSRSILLVHDQFVNSKDKIITLGEKLFQAMGNLIAIAPEKQEAMLQQLYDNILQGTLPLIGKTISFSASTLVTLFIIPIFVALVLYYREILVKFLLMIVPDREVEGFKATIREMTGTYYRFTKGMVIVYVIVGILNSIGFLLIGLPNALYFGLLASILTFFPYIGIMIGGTAAIIVAWTTYDSVYYPLGVVAVLGVVQYLEANLIFPWAVGHQLKINTLATLVAIFLGGLVWGGAGMVLFVPFAAILKILSDQVDGLKPLAVLLGPAENK